MDKGELKRPKGEIWEDFMEQLWGPHFHHGYFDLNAPDTDIIAAQIRLIDEALLFAGVSEDRKTWPKNVVDVGCGLGACSRYMAKKYGAKCQGFTISPFQVQKAIALTTAEGLAEKVSFQVADAADQPFPDGQFDLVWALEVAEQLPDKQKFVSELVRVAAPGATIIILGWWHRDLSPSEESLQEHEKENLKKIAEIYETPSWCSAAEFIKFFESHGLQDIKHADWTRYVAPFGAAKMRALWTWKGLTTLLRCGFKPIRALLMPFFMKGNAAGLLGYKIVVCRKPE